MNSIVYPLCWGKNIRLMFKILSLSTSSLLLPPSCSTTPFCFAYHRPGFLNLGTTDMTGQTLLCPGRYPVHHRMLLLIPGLYLFPFMSRSIFYCMWLFLLHNLFVGKWGGSCVGAVFSFLSRARRKIGGGIGPK